MDESDNQQDDKDTKVSIINAVKTPLGFFVLVVLIVEAILAITANISSGNDRTYAIVGMLILIFSLVFIVAGMALFRPASLYGKPTSSTTLTLTSRPAQSRISKSQAKETADLSRFFGEDILTEEFWIVHGTFSKIPSRENGDEKPIYQKVFRDKTKYQMVPPDAITTLNTVHALSYFLQEFSKYRAQPFRICTDTDALPMYHKNTFLSISGPLSNEFTDVALRDKNNKFLRFEIRKGERGNYGVIESISDGRIFELQSEEIGSDLGIIVKLRNSQAVGKFTFICAGIEKCGTSAAVWYLTNRWQQLHKEFGSREFGIVIKVMRDQDNLATKIYTVQ